jgi:uncharacterized membrane protein
MTYRVAEPGSPIALIEGLFRECEKRGMSQYSSQHAVSWILEQHATLTAEHERLRAALTHEVYRNHEHTDACPACMQSDAVLAVLRAPGAVRFDTPFFDDKP